MPNEPDWEDIFRPADDEGAVGSGDARSARAGRGQPDAPVTRRQLRESAGRPRRRKKRRGWLWALLIVGVLVVAGGTTAWTLFPDKVCKVLGCSEPTDYEGAGNGEEVVVVIRPGDIGEDVARELSEAGVTKTFDAFYQLLLSRPDVNFQPGNFRLEKQMSAEAALAALQDPASKLINTVTIPEGIAAVDALALVASATGLSQDELISAAKDYTSFGVPEDAPSIEGFLFPATYQFDPGITAQDAIQRLVDEMTKRLDAAGVAPDDRLRVLTLASIIQRESGPNVEDMYKIARVFTNRLDEDMRLESDATVTYGTGNVHTVWTTGEERNDESNPYNTYAHPGLPIGPIGLPGADAIDAALHPTDGPWIFFVTVNLKTGETVFSTTIDEHDRAVAQLRSWCNASAENQSYCG